MKHLNKVLLFAVLLAAFSACKKGPDDPFISFRSRKARVAGDWTLKSGTSNSSSSSNNTSSTDNLTYTDNSYSEVSSTTFNNVTNSNNFSGSHTLKMSFKKDGSFTSTETWDGDVTLITGTWNFTSGIGKHKNKEQIVITFKTYSGGNSSYTYTGNDTDMTFDLKELRNKKMVLTNESGSTSANNNNTSKTELTFEQ